MMKSVDPDQTCTVTSGLGLNFLVRSICPGPAVIKLLSCSSEHEIFTANKYENANNSWHFHIY